MTYMVCHGVHSADQHLHIYNYLQNVIMAVCKHIRVLQFAQTEQLGVCTCTLASWQLWLLSGLIRRWARFNSPCCDCRFEEDHRSTLLLSAAWINASVGACMSINFNSSTDILFSSCWFLHALTSRKLSFCILTFTIINLETHSRII